MSVVQIRFVALLVLSSTHSRLSPVFVCMNVIHVYFLGVAIWLDFMLSNSTTLPTTVYRCNLVRRVIRCILYCRCYSDSNLRYCSFIAMFASSNDRKGVPRTFRWTRSSILPEYGFGA